MKMTKDAKIEKACAGKKDGRTTLEQPYLDTKHKRMIATNGRAMAIVNVEIHENDTDGHIGADVLQAARKDKNSPCVSIIAKNGVVELPNGNTLVRCQDANVRDTTYPQYTRCIPSGIGANKKQDGATLSISLDPELLKNLADAIGCNKWITLHIKSDCDPIGITTDNSVAYGVIMPMRPKM